MAHQLAIWIAIGLPIAIAIWVAIRNHKGTDA